MVNLKLRLLSATALGLATLMLAACAAHDYRIASWPPAVAHLDEGYESGDPGYLWATLLASAPEGGQALRGEAFSDADRQALIDEWSEVRETWFANRPFLVSRSDITTYHRNAVRNVENSEFWHVNALPEGATGFISEGIHQQETDRRQTTWAVVDIPVNSVEEGARKVEEISQQFAEILAQQSGWTRQDGQNRYNHYSSQYQVASAQADRLAGQETEVAQGWRQRADTLARLQNRPLESEDFMYIAPRGSIIVMISNEAEEIENRYAYAMGRIVRPVEQKVRVEFLYNERIN